MWPMIIGGAMSLYGNYQQQQAMNNLEGPDLDAISKEMDPWRDMVTGLSNRADTLTGKGYGLADKGYELSSRGYGMADLGYGYLDEAKDFMDPRGQYTSNLMNIARENLGDTANEETRRLQQAMAQTGNQSQGVNTLLESVTRNKMMENIRKSGGDARESGFQRGMQMRQMGIGTIGQGLGYAGTGLGHVQSGLGVAGQGVGQYGKATDQQRQINENMVRAREADRQFQNQQTMYQAQNNPWSQMGSGLMGFGMGMQSMNPGSSVGGDSPGYKPGKYWVKSLGDYFDIGSQEHLDDLKTF